jgi:hypothetical protein
MASGASRVAGPTVLVTQISCPAGCTTTDPAQHDCVGCAETAVRRATAGETRGWTCTDVLQAAGSAIP